MATRPRRRLTIAAMLVLVALIAVGLVGYLRFDAWWKLRRVHPEFAPVERLVSGSLRSNSCIGCHSDPQAKALALAPPPASAVACPADAVRSVNCKACHVP